MIGKSLINFSKNFANEKVSMTYLKKVELHK